MSRLDEARDLPTWRLTGDDALTLARATRSALGRVLRNVELLDGPALATLAVASRAMLDALDRVERRQQLKADTP